MRPRVPECPAPVMMTGSNRISMILDSSLRVPQLRNFTHAIDG
jgi:hypothetical protein